MRYSVLEDDEGFMPYQELLMQGKYPIVLLDSVEIREVITVDTDVGYVLKASEPLRVQEGTDKIATEEVYGNFNIEFKTKDWK